MKASQHNFNLYAMLTFKVTNEVQKKLHVLKGIFVQSNESYISSTTNWYASTPALIIWDTSSINSYVAMLPFKLWTVGGMLNLDATMRCEYT
jgi:uncharacterized membrane protein